jgi:hypothetical protein
VLPAGLAGFFGRGNDGDGRWFTKAGRMLLSPHWRYAFSDPKLQVGPLQLVFFGSVGRSDPALAIVLAVATASLLLVAMRALDVERPSLLAGVVLAAIPLGFTSIGYESGHPADPLLPLVWILAAAAARRGRVVRAGVLIGLGAGFETWGILGVAVLALAPRWRDGGRGALTAAAVAAGLYLPFVAFGSFAMGGYHWPVSGHSLVSLFVPPGSAFGWGLRLAQGGFALAAGIAVARATRSSSHALWVTPLVIVAARLLFDPLDSLYYFSGIEGPALVGAALLASRSLPFASRRREAPA